MLPVELQAVVFDAVGTLIDPEPPAAIVYAEVGRHFGSRLTAVDIGPRFAAAFARREEHDRAAGLRTSEQREVRRWREIVAEVLPDVSQPDRCFQELYQHFARPAAWRCAPETTAVLQALSGRGLSLALASNYDCRLRRVVAGLPELALARHLIISSEVGWRKPAPEFFAAVGRVVGEPAGRILFVGDDRANDYDGARAAGLHALLLDPGGRESGGLQRITRLSELLNAIPIKET
jgi:putative hydrolase of the HAD superfamily